MQRPLMSGPVPFQSRRTVSGTRQLAQLLNGNPPQVAALASRTSVAKPSSSESSSRQTRRASLLEQLELRQVFAAPTLSFLPDVNLLSGAPMQIALDGFDADGDDLTFTVTSSNPDIIPQIRAATNRSLELNVSHIGDGTASDPDFSGAMIFQLFDDLVPSVTNRIATLAGDGFYDGIIFHRVINNFVIQAGDPNGIGTGGSGVRFDDAFVPMLQHTVTGLLSMAKSGDDTNDSQFFVTEGPARHLDFNHSIFGLLTEGENLRELASNVPTSGNPDNVPLNDVTITSANVYVKRDDGVLTILAENGITGSTTITVRATDSNGEFTERTFTVNATPDTNNNTPFFVSVPREIRVTAGTQGTFQLQASDIEGSTLTLGAILQDNADSNKLTVNANANTGEILLTPAAGFIGSVPIYVGVTDTDFSSESVYDAQRIAVVVVPTAPTSVDLLSGSDTGSSSADNFTNLNNSAVGNELTFRVTGVTIGHTVKLYSDGVLIGQAVATATTVDVTTNGSVALTNGLRNITATQAVVNQMIEAGNYQRTGDIESDPSTAISVVIDNVAPVISSSPVTSATFNIPYSYDVQSPEEGSTGLAYSLANAPAGMTINATTGVINWTPTLAQAGTANVTVRVVDLSGNIADQPYVINVLGNTPPTLNAIANQNGSEGTLLTLTAVAQDVNNDALTFSLTTAPSNATINPTTGLLSFNPNELQGGTVVNFTVRVTDTAGGFAERSFTVTVAEVNALPTIVQLATQTASESNLFTVQVSASDSDLPANQLTYSLINNPPVGMTISNTGVIEWTPGLSDGNTQRQINVRVSDGTATADMTFTLNVLDFNVAPVLPAIAQRNASEGVLFTQNISAQDDNLPFDTLTYSLVSGPANASINSSTGLFSFTPDEQQGGTVQSITVRVTDGLGLFDETTFDIVVAETNTAPTITPIGTQSATENQVFAVSVIASDSDVPSNTLSYSLVSGPAGMTISSLGVITWTPGEADGGTNRAVTTRVSDNAGGFADVSFTINVTEANQLPSLTVDDNHTVSELTTLSFAASASDADSPQQALTFSLLNAPAGMTINPSTGVVSWTPTEAQGPAGYNFQVRVTDSLGGTDTKNVSVTVEEVNLAPNIAPVNNQNTFQGSVFQLQLSGSDVDLPPQQLVYVLENAPAGMTINATTGQIQWSIPTDFTGSQQVQLHVTDGLLQSSTISFNIVVSEFNFGSLFGLFPQGNITRVASVPTSSLVLPVDNEALQQELVSNNSTLLVTTTDVASEEVIPLINNGLGRLQANNLPPDPQSQETQKPETKVDGEVKKSSNEVPAPPVIPQFDLNALPLETVPALPVSQRQIRPQDAALAGFLFEQDLDQAVLALEVSRQVANPYADLKQLAKQKQVADQQHQQSNPELTANSTAVPTVLAAAALAVSLGKSKSQKNLPAPVVIPVMNTKVNQKRGRWTR